MKTSETEPLKITPLVYTIQQTALALNMSDKSVRRLIKRGLFRPSRALRKILIPRNQIEAFLKSTCDNR